MVELIASSKKRELIKNKYNALTKTEEELEKNYPKSNTLNRRRSREIKNIVNKRINNVNSLNQMRNTIRSRELIGQEIEKEIKRLKYLRGSLSGRMKFLGEQFLEKYPKYKDGKLSRVSIEEYRRFHDSKLLESSDIGQEASKRNSDALDQEFAKMHAKMHKIARFFYDALSEKKKNINDELKEMKKLQRANEERESEMQSFFLSWMFTLADANLVQVCKFDQNLGKTIVFPIHSIVNRFKLSMSSDRFNPDIIKFCDLSTGDCGGGVTCVYNEAVVDNSSRGNNQKNRGTSSDGSSNLSPQGGHSIR